MAEVENKSNERSFLAKMGGVAKTGGKIVAEEFKYFIDPRNWNDSGDKIRHEAKQAFNKALGKPTEEYTQSVRDVQRGITRASKALGIEVTGYKKGRMTFEASRALAGDVFHLTDEQFNQIKELNKKSEYLKIAINKGSGKIIIEVDVDAIIKKFKKDIDAQGLEVSEEQIKKLAIARIIKEVDSSLKNFGGITGGEFKLHTDLKLLDAIGKALYREDVSQKKDPEKSSEVVESVQGESPLETETLSLSRTLTPKSNEEPSEAFRRIVQEAAKPLVGGGVTEEPPVGDGMEAARKAAREAIVKAKESQDQSPRNVGIDSKGLAKLPLGQQLTGGCGVQANGTWQERQEQAVGPQGSQGFKR